MFQNYDLPILLFRLEILELILFGTTLFWQRIHASNSVGKNTLSNRFHSSLQTVLDAYYHCHTYMDALLQNAGNC
jgi:hypothetical protein